MASVVEGRFAAEGFTLSLPIAHVILANVSWLFRFGGCGAGSLLSFTQTIVEEVWGPRGRKRQQVEWAALNCRSSSRSC